MKKTINIIFIVLIGFSLILGLTFILIAPNDINDTENRYAEKLAKPSLNNILESVFQDSVELTAADQLPFAENAKAVYNKAFSSYSKACLEALFSYEEKKNSEYSADTVISDAGIQISEENASSAAVEIPVQTDSAVEIETEVETAPAVEENKPSGPDQEQINASSDRYVSLGGGIYLYKGRLVQGYSSLSSNKDRGALFIANFNKLIDLYPDINFYCYYIEKESDCQLTTGQKSGFYEYLKEGINLPDNHMGRLEVSSFNDYSNYFYETDHHWAYKGSFQGYKGIMSMLKPSDTVLTPLDELRIGICKGSLANNEMTSSYSEVFYAYEFAFPSMEITSDGKSIGYGSQKTFIDKARNGNINQSVAYWSFYGVDLGEIVFHNPGGSGSLMVFGNSYDNAVLKLIASHYEYTYSIDLRYYKKLTGHEFSFADYVSSHHIDDVLHIGSSTYFVQAPFRVPE